MEPRRSSSRPALVLGSLALLVALLAGGCSTGSAGASSVAATVNGVEISQDQVVKITKATQRFYRYSVKQGQDSSGQLSSLLDQMQGQGTDTMGLAGTNAVLGELITDEVIRQELADRKALPTDDDRQSIRQQITQQVGGDKALAKFDRTYVDYYVRQSALQQAYQKVLAAEADKGVKPLTEAERKKKMLELYQQVAPTLPLCLNIILTTTKDEAQAARDRVDGGEDFAAVAKDVSTDAASADKGGFAGCASYDDAKSALSVDFTGAEVGQLFGPTPYQGQQGTQFAVIEVEGTQGPTYAQLEPRLETSVPAQPTPTDPTTVDAATPLRKLLRKAEIDVNSRFGSWNSKTLVVDPPPSPPSPPTSASTIPVITTTTTAG